MYILVLNCGSSSLKYKVYSEQTMQAVVSGSVEKIGLVDSCITQKYPDGEKEKKAVPMNNHDEALGVVFNMLRAASIDMNDIRSVGHRVVMGGDKFKSSVKIDDNVIKGIEECKELAPLHNPAGLKGINAARQLLPNATQVAVFDTAFHQTMPEYAFTYALPKAYRDVLGARRYGFHGTSILSATIISSDMLGIPAEKCNLIILHIGSGASATAIRGGRSVDTSMGMTPTPGLTMGTRCGDIDPAIIPLAEKKLGLNADQILAHLNKDSGLLAITECYSDRRDIEENSATNDKCRLAMDIEVHNVKKYIGAYMAELGHVDAIVFTAGVGENDDILRERFCSGLEELGVKLDKEANKTALARKGIDRAVISTPDSRVKILMIAADEELVIANDTLAIKNGTFNPDPLKMKYSFAKMNKSR